MKKFYVASNRAIISLSFIVSLLMFKQGTLFAQTATTINQYVVYSGSKDATKNGIELGGGQTISGNGYIGSSQNITSTGNLTLTGSIFSARYINYLQ
jgi:hypothetical protein